MTLAALRDVYNPLAIKKEQRPPLQDWTESVPVILLSEYIKMQKHVGIKLYQDEGMPCLCFNPGTRSLEIIEAATLLLENAADDLKELIANGKLIVSQYPHDSSRYVVANKITGPSSDSAITGNSNRDVCEV